MLSRVAETLYWLARYVERAENTARVVSVNANLLLDLPKGIETGWQPLIAITGSEELYRELYPDFEERNVVKYLVGDQTYPSSIIACLGFARENARTIRDFLPREAWELVNELYLYARDQLQSGLSKRDRHTYLKQIILRSQTLDGLLNGTMNHDEGHRFMHVGRMLERGDMTTRIIDVRSATLLSETTGLLPFENIQWIGVLKSLSAYQMYRRKMQVRVRRANALKFLLTDPEFPRSVYHCVTSVDESVRRLPRNESVRRTLTRLKRYSQQADVAALVEDNVQLHDFIDRLQIGLGRVHEAITTTYFLAAPSPELVRSA